MAHELSSLRTKVAEMHKGMQECDSQREAAEEANRQMHTNVQSLEGQVRRSEMRLATQDAATRQEIWQLRTWLRSAQNTLRDAEARRDAGADLQRRVHDLQAERDGVLETIKVQALLLEVRSLIYSLCSLVFKCMHCLS